mmetsp:Transcript_49917/g.125159  ORF Transcript_49917/g.125159 Transcript_49917/m.125159 type:complete len:277 (-) Transcript_49917:147-977(-)
MFEDERDAGNSGFADGGDRVLTQLDDERQYFVSNDGRVSHQLTHAGHLLCDTFPNPPVVPSPQQQLTQNPNVFESLWATGHDLEDVTQTRQGRQLDVGGWVVEEPVERLGQQGQAPAPPPLPPLVLSQSTLVLIAVVALVCRVAVHLEPVHAPPIVVILIQRALLLPRLCWRILGGLCGHLRRLESTLLTLLLWHIIAGRLLLLCRLVRILGVLAVGHVDLVVAGEYVCDGMERCGEGLADPGAGVPCQPAECVAHHGPVGRTRSQQYTRKRIRAP